MEATPLPRIEPLSFGGLLDRAFRMTTDSFALLVGIAAVLMFPLALVEGGLGLALSDSPTANALIQGLIGVISGLFLQPLILAATCLAVSERYLGNELTIGHAYSRALSRLWAVLGTQIVIGFLTMLAALALIVPGIYVGLGYAVAVPALIIEQLEGPAARARSWSLVEGHRWRLLLTLFVVNAVVAGFAMGIAMVMLMMMGGAGEQNSLLSAALQSLAQVVMTPFSTVVTVLLYYDLRVRKEGFDLEMLTSALFKAETKI